MKIIFTFFFVVVFMRGFAQDTTITILTSAQCGTCKKRIENAMAFEKGVKQVSLDVSSKILTITYDKKKNSHENLRQAVAKIGYDADSVPANPKAYKKLPKCCQKSGMKEKCE
jgi:copper chaperone CopZ